MDASDTTEMNAGMTQTITLRGNFNREDMETALGGIQGVRDVEFHDDEMVVRYDPTVVDENEIKAAAQNGGLAPLADGTAGGDTGGLWPSMPSAAGDTNRNSTG